MVGKYWKESCKKKVTSLRNDRLKEVKWAYFGKKNIWQILLCPVKLMEWHNSKNEANEMNHLSGLPDAEDDYNDMSPEKQMSHCMLAKNMIGNNGDENSESEQRFKEGKILSMKTK